MKPRTGAVIILGLRESDGEIERVRALGYKSILLSTCIDMQQALEADLPIEIDLNNEDLVLKRLKQIGQKYDIRGVYTLNEYRVPLGARIAAQLGITHHISVEAALNCRHKDRTRHLLSECNVGSAEFRAITEEQEIASALTAFTFPVIVKPSNDAGSHLVAQCGTVEEVFAAFRAIVSQPENWVGQQLSTVILIEEFLDGPEYSVESYSTQDNVYILAITEKQITLPPLSIEVGHLVPALLRPEDENAVKEVVLRALAVLGVTHSVAHTEVKFTSKGPRIIEVNARPGGDHITVLVRAVTGVDLREIALHLAVGDSSCCFQQHEPLAPSAAIQYLIAPSSGTVDLTNLAALEELYEAQLSVASGDPVSATTSNYNRLGYLIALGTPERGAQRVLADALHDLQFQVIQDTEVML